MNSYVQVISLLVSFIYGIVFYILSKFNKYIISNKNNIVKLLVTTVYVVDMVIIYIFIMYKINFGNIHPYFIISLILGFALSIKCKFIK